MAAQAWTFGDDGMVGQLTALLLALLLVLLALGVAAHVAAA
jgi:hypothetical protein